MLRLASCGASVVGFAASVPPHYARALRYSSRNLHAPEAMKVGLERLGIPFEAHVLYWTAVLVLLAAVFFLVGAIIFWRRSDDPAALFFSITLVAFGAIWPNTLDALAGIHPLLDITRVLIEDRLFFRSRPRRFATVSSETA